MARILILCSIPVLLTGCVSSGFRTPDYVFDLDIPERGLPPAADRDPSSPHAELRRLADQSVLELNALLRIADLSNPDIAAARHEVGAAAGRTWQAELYPNPVLELEAEEVPTDHIGLGRSKNIVSITQPVIVGGRRSAAVGAATAEQEARRLALEAKRRDVLAEVRLAHIEILYIKQAIALHAELFAVAQQTHDIARTRLDARAAPETEVIKSEIEVLELELGRRRLERRQVAVSERLRSLLGDVEIPLERIEGELPPEPGDVDFDRLRSLVKESHPALLAAAREVEAAELRVDQAGAERYPDIGVRLAYGRDTAENENLVEAGITIPLPFFNRNQGSILEAKHLLGRARRKADSLANRFSAELAVAHSAYMTARDEMNTFRKRLVPAATTALSQARDGYRAGRTSLLDLLDAQRTLARARLSLLESLRDASLARARLWKIAGPGLGN